MSDRYETPRWDDEIEEPGGRDLASTGTSEPEQEAAAPDLDASSENVLDGWPATTAADADDSIDADVDLDDELPAATGVEVEPPAATNVDVDALGEQSDLVEEEADPDVPTELPVPLADHVSATSEHAPGDLTVPPGYSVLEGEPAGERRAVGVVVARFNGDVTTRLLDSALAELEACGVARDAITVMPVPGAFELPLAAMALAKTRRFACIVALGCVIRGDTPHFDYVSSEAASGLQLAAIETGVPVAFGVLTLDRADQAESRSDKGAEAVRTGLEMADVFANLRAAAAR